MSAAVPSPCINVCKMDAENALCLGCLRTLEEIAQWSRASNTVKQEILDAVARRRVVQEAAGRK
ncbi:MAG: DUF1289 domain-containing protein [Zoogloeaceae bacterium]|nr:DUF1289 domain-containing protein [Zoogloeaceae bacterium]